MILLFNPPTPNGRGYTREGRCTQEAGVWGTQWPPLSLATATTLLRQDGHRVILRDYPAVGLDLRALVENVRKFQPDVTIWSTGTPTIQHDLALARLVCESAPKTVTAVIGTHVTVRPEGQEAWGARHDHHYAHEFIKKIPKRAIVLTHVPTMFLLWGQNAIQAYAGLNHPDIIRDLMTRYRRGDVYFHQSYWCNALNDANRTICDGIRQHYNLEPVAVVREQTHEYGLYRMTFK